ncbi:MAG: heavy-metal-associated domain-containing protein [Betaproteobacteria bacterium]|nr:heavy-metal-associated domain-containing protein [Betaproteobacteria bacterium]
MSRETCSLQVLGMHCDGCVRNVTAVLSVLPGVSRVAVLLDPGEARIEFDPQAVSREDLIAAVEDAGFDAS